MRAAAGVAAAVALAGGALAAGCAEQPERSDQALCERLPAVARLDESLAIADVTALRTEARELREALAVAPPALEGPLATISASVDALVATIDTATGDRREALTEALRAQEGDADALTAAGQAVSRFSADTCGLDLGSGATVPTTAAPTTAAPTTVAPAPAPPSAGPDATTPAP